MYFKVVIYCNVTTSTWLHYIASTKV